VKKLERQLAVTTQANVLAYLQAWKDVIAMAEACNNTATAKELRLLSPSPCGVKGHRNADLVERRHMVSERDGGPFDEDPYYVKVADVGWVPERRITSLAPPCLACLREKRLVIEVERGRKIE
jgi:hypothetical protein